MMLKLRLLNISREEKNSSILPSFPSLPPPPSWLLATLLFSFQDRKGCIGITISYHFPKWQLCLWDEVVSWQEEKRYHFLFLLLQIWRCDGPFSNWIALISSLSCQHLARRCRIGIENRASIIVVRNFSPEAPKLPPLGEKVSRDDETVTFGNRNFGPGTWIN